MGYFIEPTNERPDKQETQNEGIALAFVAIVILVIVVASLV